MTLDWWQCGITSGLFCTAILYVMYMNMFSSKAEEAVDKRDDMSTIWKWFAN